MAGIGNYSKGEKFALKSGNNTSFKMMGSSETIKEPTDQEKAEKAKEGLAWNEQKQTWMKVWKDKK